MVAKGIKKLFGKKNKKLTFEEKQQLAEKGATETADEPEPEKVEEEEREEAANETEEQPDPTSDVTIIIEEPTADGTVLSEETKEKVDDDAEFGEEKREILSEEDEDEEEEDKEKLHYKRINTMHAELYVPLDAKSGDILDIEHDGSKQIKVPKGQQGQSITVKMISNNNPEQETGAFCGCL